MLRSALLAVLLLVTGCMSVVGGVAAKAAPDTAEYVAPATGEYIQWLHHARISYTSEQDAIDFGLAQCSKIRDGQPVRSVANDVRDTDVIVGGSVSLSSYLVNVASFALCPDTALQALDSWHHLSPYWDAEAPDRAQRFLDRYCLSDLTRRNICVDIPLPESVANRLGGQDNPATRVLFGELCAEEPDTPPCVADTDAISHTDRYLRFLGYSYVRYTSEQDALDSGFAVCSKLHDGQSVDSVLEDVSDSGVFSGGGVGPVIAMLGGMANVVESASSALCPDTFEAVMDSHTAQLYPGYSGMKQENPDLLREIYAWHCEGPVTVVQAPVCFGRDWGPPPSRERWLALFHELNG